MELKGSRITKIVIHYQSPVSERARKRVVRRDRPGGPYRDREEEFKVDIPVGPGSMANLMVRAFIARAFAPRKGEEFYYVTANFNNDDSLWRTIVPRTQI